MNELWMELTARLQSPVFWLLLAAKGLVLLSLIALTDQALRGASAALRHRLWTVALAGMLALPLLSLTAPGIELSSHSLSTAPAKQLMRGLEQPVVRNPQTRTSPKQSPATGATQATTPRPPQPRVKAPAGSESAASAAAIPAGSGLSWLRENLTWGLALAGVWMVGLLLVAFRYTLEHVRLMHLTRTARPLETPLRDRVDALVERHPVGRAVRWLEGTDAVMPMTWGVLRAHLLLPRSAVDWPAERLRAVVLHELAHIRRRDHAVQLLAQAVCALWWWNPLVWVAARRLRVEREHACDDAVLQAGADPSDYADTLLAVARSLRLARLTSATATPVAPRSQLEGRLLAVMDPRRSRSTPSRLRSVPLVAIALALVTGLSLLQVATGSAHGFKHGSHRGTTVIEDDGVWTVLITRDGYHMDAELRGSVVFSNDETGIASMGRKAKFILMEDEDGLERKVTVTGSGTDLEYRYEVDEDDRPWDEEGQRWLAKVLPKFFRVSGVQAEERVNRLHDRGGTDAVIDEILLMDSGYTIRRYYEVLTQLEQPDANQLRRLLQHAESNFGSDYDLASLLEMIAMSRAFGAEHQVAYARALNSIDSDYERRRALGAFLEKESLAPETVTLILRSASDMDSDYELATFLIALADRHHLEETEIELMLRAAESLESDYEMRRVLDRVVESGRLSQASVAEVLRLAGQELDSDYELAQILITVAHTYPLEDDARAAYRRAARGLDSDYESDRALAALEQNGSRDTSR